MKGIIRAQWINLFWNNGFILYMPITFFVRKKWSRTRSGTGSYGRQVAGDRRNTGEFGIF